MKKPVLYKKRGKAWYFRRANEATFHSTGKTTRTAAENYVKDLPVEESVPAGTLRDFAEGFFRWGSAWIERQHAKKRHFGKAQAKNRQGHLDKYILPRFGDSRLDDITQPDVESWLVGLRLANATKNHILYTLRIVLREAKARKLIAENPLQEPEPLGKESKSRDIFSAAELKALFPAGKLAEVWYSQSKGALFMVLASTGIRSGEARALAWRQVLWAERALLVDRTVDKSGDIGSISEKKGGAKIVLIPSKTAAELKDWLGKSFWNLPEDIIFPGETRGRPLGSAAVSHALGPAIRRVNAAAKKKGLPAPIEVGKRTLVVHSFRHGFNTALRRLVPEGTLRLLMGHRSEAMTDRYDHPQIEAQLEDLEPAREAVESAFKLD